MPGNPLESVDLFRAGRQPSDGLIPVRGQAATSPSLSIDERAAIADAAAFSRIDYLFFRRFSDGRSSQVAAFVVDNSDERLDAQALAKLHQQLWLHGAAPLLYVAWPSRIDILTCARGPDFWDSRHGNCRFKPAETLLADAQTAADVNAEMNKRARFSAFRLADGTFWDDPRNASLADHDKAAHQSLIQAVVETDANLHGDTRPVMRRLLLLMVLIKYLEDRHVFPAGWFGRFHKGAKSFFDVLKAAEPTEVQRLLAFLERKFNGDVFALPVSADRPLSKAALRRFAYLVEARTLSQQRYLWQQFSFEHLPVEVLSHLYQRFVQGGHGAVYTPPFLASLLLDHAMPYSQLSGDERILDPACGSGVFLVGAYKRLINVWRNRNRWQRPNVGTLKQILRRSIFGVELDPSAIDLTAFSLALAVCDTLKPEAIWGELTFDRLRQANLLEADFFQLVLEWKRGQNTILNDGFDIVVGNPPFESKISDAGKMVDDGAKQQRGKLPDKQTAYLFLEQALDTLSPRGRICLIQPSSLLYNRKTEAFRNRLFGNKRFDVVFDFTSIRNLYEADPKTIAVLATGGKPHNGHSLQHWTFRRTFSVHERLSFELDHYDRHRVSQQEAESNPFVWRINLLGGGRLHGISGRIRAMRTLEDFVREHGWDFGEGFTVGNRQRTATFLTDKPLLPTKALTDAGIDETQIDVVRETRFEAPRREELYAPPIVLIKELHSLPVAFWDNGPLAYGHEIVGVHAPQSQKPKLKSFFETFKSRRQLYRFVCAIHSSRSLIARQTALLKKDIDSLPFPYDPEELKTSFWEDALLDDVLEYMEEYVRKGQNSQLLQRKAEASDLWAYSELYCRMLGSVYDGLRADKWVDRNGLICMLFCLGQHSKVTWLAEDSADAIRDLVYEENGEQLRTVRIVRFYGENAVLIVKPDRLRYWIRSTAIRDADETLVDLREQGY